MTSVTLHSAAALTSHHLDHADLLSPGSCSGESSASLSYRDGESGGIIANEQITRLFPKCPPRSVRPAQTLRSDINLNPEPEQEQEPGQELTGTDNDNDNKRSMMDVQRDTDRSAECSALGLNAEASDGGASSSEDQAGGEPVIILTSNSGGTYKLRDSRIIEIAGGREVFSQSRSKAARKSRYITSGGDDCDRKRKSPSRPGVWEVRNRGGIDQHKNSGRNGPELTETMFSTEVHSVRHQRPAVPAISPLSPPNSPPKSRGGGGTVGMLSSSPPGGTMLKTVNAAGVQSQTPITPLTPPRSLAVVAGGEVVVFDDIGENWQGLRLDLENEAQANNCHSPDNVDGNSTGASSTGSPVYHCSTTDYIKTDIEISARSPENKVARVIGSLPIAEYEGSPRRYRPRQTEMTSMNPVLPSAHSLLSSPSMYPPRPGFPQRILPRTVEPESDTDLESLTLAAVETSPTDNSTFDYLYEFSETRKVLEEFFKCPPRDEENKALEDLSDFNDLDYELHRQPGSGSSYVGHRLAKTPTSQDEIPVNDSPRKNHSIHMQEHDDYEHSNNFLELSVGTASSEDLGDADVGLQVGHSRNFTLSPETTDCDSNCGDLDSEVSLMLMENDFGASVGLLGSAGDLGAVPDSTRLYTSMPVLEDGLSSGHASDTDNNNPTVMLMKRQITEIEREIIQRTSGQMDRDKRMENGTKERIDIDLYSKNKDHSFEGTDPELEAMDPFNIAQATPPPPAPAPHRRVSLEPPAEVEAALKDIRATLQRTKALPVKSPQAQDTPEQTASPVWVQRQRGASRASADSDGTAGGKVLSGDEGGDEEEADTDLETDRLLGQQRTDDQGFYDNKDKDGKKKGRNKEGLLDDPSVLIEGVLFRARYLGSTQLVCEGQPTKSTRMMQAEEAVSRIKAPEGENQPSTEVDLFISTEKIMVLNTDLKEIMMDHALRTISYIADIGDLVVLMARRRFVPHEMDDPPKINRTPKMICHVFESEEAQFIAQSIGQAFQVAYMEFLKANGIEDHSFVKEMDYQEVLNSQEIFGDELQMFAKKEMQKEVVVPKAKGEILGVVIVESGWGSMLPTVVIANLAPAGAAARCGQLNIGDQIIAINGVSLVGLPLSTCQNYIKNSKNQTVVKLTVVPCAPVVEVKIKRPDTKYQLGFSVQNGVICSLLRGGIAERGGVRVGHRIIEINNQSVVAVPHEKIVNLLATSVGEILMKTMPTSMFRLLTGQENPVYI